MITSSMMRLSHQGKVVHLEITLKATKEYKRWLKNNKEMKPLIEDWNGVVLMVKRLAYSFEKMITKPQQGNLQHMFIQPNHVIFLLLSIKELSGCLIKINNHREAFHKVLWDEEQC